MMKMESFESVWDAIEDTPEEAQNMKIRSSLMIAIDQCIRHSGMSQEQAAQRLGVSRPRVSDLMRGKINLFTIDALTNMAVALGLKIELRVLEAAE